jgi:radical SAM superfamily enzyme YgiQ (UPF0313 family)
MKKAYKNTAFVAFIKKALSTTAIFFFVSIYAFLTSCYALSTQQSCKLRVPFVQYKRQIQSQEELSLIKAGLFKDCRKPSKILLIQPRLSTQRAKPTRLPTGLMSLASALRDKVFIKEFFYRLSKEKFIFEDFDAYSSFNVEILDLQAESIDFDLEACLAKSNPDVVGFTAVSPAIDDVSRVSSVVAKVLPSAIRIIGGPHVSALPAETLKNSNFQIAVKGEGVETFLEVLMELRSDAPSLSDVNGIYYKDENGKILGNSAATKIMKFEEYPFPGLSVDLLNIENYEELVNVDGENQGQAATLFTSRGCPYGKCIYCASKAVFNHKVDFRSAENVFKEIEYLCNKGFRAFYILDDMFTISRKRILELAELIEASDIKISYSMMTRASAIDKEIAGALKRSGCRVAAIGVESGDRRLLDEVIDKNISLDRVKRATQFLKAEGIHVKYFMMLGLPEQDWQSIKQSIDLLLETSPDSINASITIPYPGSDLYGDSRIKILNNGKNFEKYLHEAEPQIKNTAPIEAVTETNTMTNAEITVARDLMLDIFDNWKRDNEQESRSLYKELDILANGTPSILRDQVGKLFLRLQSEKNHTEQSRIRQKLESNVHQLHRAISQEDIDKIKQLGRRIDKGDASISDLYNKLSELIPLSLLKHVEGGAYWRMPDGTFMNTEQHNKEFVKAATMLASQDENESYNYFNGKRMPFTQSLQYEDFSSLRQKFHEAYKEPFIFALTVILHDYGKLIAKIDHDKYGARLVTSLLERLVSKRQTKQIIEDIRNHNTGVFGIISGEAMVEMPFSMRKRIVMLQFIDTATIGPGHLSPEKLEEMLFCLDQYETLKVNWAKARLLRFLYPHRLDITLHTDTDKAFQEYVIGITPEIWSEIEALGATEEFMNFLNYIKFSYSFAVHKNLEADKLIKWLFMLFMIEKTSSSNIMTIYYVSDNTTADALKYIDSYHSIKAIEDAVTIMNFESNKKIKLFSGVSVIIRPELNSLFIYTEALSIPVQRQDI